MSQTVLPRGYKSVLGVYETQCAIAELKHRFENHLSEALQLMRVSAPLFVSANSGLNDDLNGVERPVSFDVREDGQVAQVVHSLAKWKRMALQEYHFPMHRGLYTDMNAIRRDEDMDNLHSIYVDQWDWEKVIDRADRTEAYLQETVTQIVGAICDTQDELQTLYPALQGKLCRKVSFITAQALEDLYPGKTAKERENAYTREHGTVFIMGIGAPLRSGKPHDGRAPDYDDWSLNGDILFWDALLDRAIEISSMGIRVDAASLDAQLTAAGCDHRRSFPFHKALLEDRLPLTMGGGIGQSRLCMLLLQKAHIGEVQVSLWDEDTRRKCADAGIELL